MALNFKYMTVVNVPLIYAFSPGMTFSRCAREYCTEVREYASLRPSWRLSST